MLRFSSRKIRLSRTLVVYIQLKKTRKYLENHSELPVTHNEYICSASVNGMESPNTSRKNVCLDICPDEFECRLNAS